MGVYRRREVRHIGCRQDMVYDQEKYGGAAAKGGGRDLLPPGWCSSHENDARASCNPNSTTPWRSC